jgi:alpha-aminoadipic semialdehyde synthase
VLELMMG